MESHCAGVHRSFEEVAQVAPSFVAAADSLPQLHMDWKVRMDWVVGGKAAVQKDSRMVLEQEQHEMSELGLLRERKVSIGFGIHRRWGVVSV